jgi:hypothetical protein
LYSRRHSLASTRASRRLPNASALSSASRTLLLNDSAHPFSHGAPGSMYKVSRAAAAIHDRIAWAMNSGPLSDRTCAGAPRCRTTPASAALSALAVMPRPTSRARHSRVYSSTSVNHSSGPPSVVRSCRKSHAQTWSLRSAGGRAQLLALGPFSGSRPTHLKVIKEKWPVNEKITGQQ